MKLSYLLAISIALLPTALSAAPKQVTVPGVGRVPYERIFEARSEKGETMDAFMIRVAPQLRAYSDETGFEACAAIARSDSEDVYGVVVGSNKSHIACAIFSSMVPEGMRATGQTVHSHGGDRAFTASVADKALMMQALIPPRGKVLTVHGQTLDAFSDVDMDAGPGYLAAPDGGLLHQAGTPGSIRWVVKPHASNL